RRARYSAARAPRSPGASSRATRSCTAATCCSCWGPTPRWCPATAPSGGPAWAKWPASAFPVRETAVVLHHPEGTDLKFPLDPGRVVLTNLNKEGSARVRGSCGYRSGELTLTEPGARMALEVYGRWPAGARFSRNPKEGEVPAKAVILLALR